MSIPTNTFVDLLDIPIIEHDLYSLILKNIPISSNQIIAGYLPSKDEIEITHLLYIFSTNHKIGLPIVKGKKLIFKEWNFQEEPNKNATEISPDIIFVPCTSIGKNGYRWGHGCKFYDKTIRLLRKNKKPIITIGVGYEHQLVEEFPADKDSSQLDWILTPNRIINCR